jgi:hypothetical protein
MKAVRLGATLLIVIGALAPTSANAGNRNTPPFDCPAHYICDGKLGVALRPSVRWIRLSASREGPCTLAFARRPVPGQSYDERLIVKIVEVGNTTHDRALAQAYARSFVGRFHTQGVRVTNATYGGAPAVVIRGLPPTPRPAVYVVASYTTLVYLFTLPGKVLAQDQRQALSSLRFFIRRGTGCPPLFANRALASTAGQSPHSSGFASGSRIWSPMRIPRGSYFLVLRAVLV